MSFPSVAISNNVIFYPGGFDRLSGAGPFAAIITGIDSVNETIDLTIFPPGSDPEFRKTIEYGDDVSANKSFFILTSDSPPSCFSEATALTVFDTDAYNFVVQWTPPAMSGGSLIFYRVTGDTDWLVPNRNGNKHGTMNSAGNSFTFVDLESPVSYDILIVNICANSKRSAGVSITETTTTPL